MSDGVILGIFVLVGSFIPLIGTVWLFRANRTTEARKTAAQVAQDNAETQGIRDANEARRMKEYGNMNDNVMHLMDEVRADKQVIGELNLKVIAFEQREVKTRAEYDNVIAGLRDEIKAANGDAAAAKAEVVILKQQVKDYPADVHHLQEIIIQMQTVIDELKVEIIRSHKVSSDITEAGLINARKELENSTALHAPVPETPASPTNENTDKIVAVKITGTLLAPEKPEPPQDVRSKE